MKNILIKLLSIFGYKIIKSEPFPKEAIPFNLVSFIFYKIKDEKNLKCLVVEEISNLDSNEIINKEIFLNKIPKKILSLKKKSLSFLKNFLKKQNFKVLVIRNNRNNIYILKEIIKSSFVIDIILLDIKNISQNRKIYNINKLMLSKKYGVIKFWNYLIYVR